MLSTTQQTWYLLVPFWAAVRQDSFRNAGHILVHNKMHRQIRQLQAQEALLKAQLEGKKMEEEGWTDVMDRLDPKSEEN